jgi:pyridoxal phosphate enzyme (YggS family)
MINPERLHAIQSELKAYNATLIAVSKKQPVSEIKTAIENGQQQFGENYVQELVEKQAQIPFAEWHFIGTLQRNKVKTITPFISMIQSVDSLKLLQEINKQAEKNKRIINCLLQVYIAKEETKNGLTEEEAIFVLQQSVQLQNIKIKGLMGMATNTAEQSIIRNEFMSLKKLYDELKQAFNFNTLCIGMSSDYRIALDCGSNMVRIGSAIFGERKR